MSGLIVGLVLRTPISEEFNTEAKFIATVYADHAWEDGTHAYPAVDTVAGMVGMHPRTVQRYLRALEGLGMLIADGKGPRGTNKYKFPLEAKPDGSIRLSLARGGTQPPLQKEEQPADSGGAVPPRQPARGDTESGDTDSGGASATRTNNPSDLVLVVNAGTIAKSYEEEFGALTAMVRDAINDAMDTYPIDWIPEAMQIAVKSNVRKWVFVEGILKNCKAKNVRPSLNKLEAQKYAKHNSAGSPKKPASTPVVEADKSKIAEINQRRRDKQSQPAL